MSAEIEKENINKKKFIKLSEAADIMGVHKNTLYGWVREDWENKHNQDKKKNIKFSCPPYTRLRAHYLFLKEDIEKFVQDLAKE